jgi:hypothetical protein
MQKVRLNPDWLRALGALDSLSVQAEHVYDLLPESRQVAEAYDAVIEALEALQRAVQRVVGRPDDDDDD